MHQLHLICKHCGRIFPSGFPVGPGITLVGNKSQCPHCGSIENVPDISFRETVTQFADILATSENPLTDAKQLVSELSSVSSNNALRTIKKKSKFAKWFPDSPEKIAAYVAIASTAVALLIRSPETQITYNQVFIEQYNVCIVEAQDKR